MAYFVYIIQSEKDGTYYKGATSDPAHRLIQHNEGFSTFTSSRIPWKLVYVEELNSKREMLIRERKLKRGNSEYFKLLFASQKNIVKRFT